MKAGENVAVSALIGLAALLVVAALVFPLDGRGWTTKADLAAIEAANQQEAWEAAIKSEPSLEIYQVHREVPVMEEYTATALSYTFSISSAITMQCGTGQLVIDYGGPELTVTTSEGCTMDEAAEAFFDALVPAWRYRCGKVTLESNEE